MLIAFWKQLWLENGVAVEEEGRIGQYIGGFAQEDFEGVAASLGQKTGRTAAYRGRNGGHQRRWRNGHNLQARFGMVCLTGVAAKLLAAAPRGHRGCEPPLLLAVRFGTDG